MPLLQQITTDQMFKMSIVVLNYMYTRHMKDTRVTILLCQIHSMFLTHCIAHFAVLSSEMIFV